jgi:ankyrin repeat protein
MLRISFKRSVLKNLVALAAFLPIACTAFAQDPNSNLIEAARSHDLAKVRKLLSEGADPNRREKTGKTPLMEASAYGYTDTMRVLLENGAQVNAADAMGWTALFWAFFSRRTDSLHLLITKGADINAKDNENKSALFWAASSGDTGTVKTLLRSGAKVNAKDSHGWTPLMIAADLGQLEAVRVLVAKGADIQAKDKDGNTAMSLAEKYKYSEIVTLLQHTSSTTQQRSGDPSSKGSRAIAPASDETVPANVAKHSKTVATSPTPPPVNPVLSKSERLNETLLQAAESGDTAEVLRLIREGAGVNTVGITFGNTALIKAAGRGYTNTVRALLDKGAEVDARDNAGHTALIEAAFGGYTDTAELLLEKGASVNASDSEGWTPLFWATFSRRTGTVRLLLDKGANVNSRNKYQVTALIHAAYAGDSETVMVLLEHQAEVDAKDDMGKTALIEAAHQGHSDTARLLLQHGATVDLQAHDGTTAVSSATQQRHADIVAMLKNPPQRAVLEEGDEKSPSPTESLAGSATTSDPIATEMQTIQKKSRARAFYGLGLSMDFLEQLWPKMDQRAERAAATVLGDLRKVEAPEELIDMAQKTLLRLSYPTQESKEPIQPLIEELRNRLDTYCSSRPDDKFFYAAGSFTYELDQLGQDLEKPDAVDGSVENARRKLLMLANNFAARCAAIPECKNRGLSLL